MSERPSSMMRLLYLCVTATALLLLGALTLANANTSFFGHYYPLLYSANVAIAIIAAIVILGFASAIAIQWHRQRFGSRLMAKLAIYFTLVGVVPGTMLYLVSLQFISRSIESWFDNNVESALTAGVDMGRVILDESLRNLKKKAFTIAEQLSDFEQSSLSFQLIRLREQQAVENATVLSNSGTALAYATGTLARLLPDDLPSAAILDQAKQRRFYAAVESRKDSDASQDSSLWLRVVIHLQLRHKTGLRGPEFLQLTQPVPNSLAKSAEELQRGYNQYQEKAFARSGLRKMYIGALTLSLFLATFIALALAFALGNQLARPLLLLVKGTAEVARGDYSPKTESKTKDELGLLTQSFNLMTRQLAEARAAVTENRVALENSNHYLENILANLSSGVFVLDSAFVLKTTNAGAEEILHKKFNNFLNQPLNSIRELEPLAEMIQANFLDHSISENDHEESPRWQKHFSLSLQQGESMTLLVRGAPLLQKTSPAGPAPRHPTGYLVVFDDVSDLISAQRSIAWTEVARRLAHEIKNPLTPIQLSTERLQIKLSNKLSPTDASILQRATTTIINQVSSMKRMVDDFRNYASIPRAQLQKLQLNELITEVVSLYQSEEEKGMIELRLTDIPLIDGDPTQLRQIIHNLLQNAQDAVAEAKDPWIRLKTEVTAYGGHPNTAKLAVRMTVTDNGPGFAPHSLKRAFEPYVTTKPKGTGLGLAMVKKIVDEHGGFIDIRNLNGDAENNVKGAQVSILFVKIARPT